MKRSNRLAWIGAIALGVMILLTFIAAPTSSKINSGSTYNRAPDGYGAWYAYMERRGTGIKRWQKPFDDLNAEKRPVTLVQINSILREPLLDAEEKKWIEKGNNLVLLGVRDRVTAADFTTIQKSPAGDVKIETRRRRQIKGQEKVSLGDDRFGAVVWENNYGQGKAIFSTTPYLAANAYQDYQSHFQYLSDLVSQKGHLLFVDEYIHGYKEPSVRKREGEGSLLSYFTKTPVFPAFLQVGILLLLLIRSQNRRFGKPVTLNTPVVDNSEAYIKALAGVLQKAKSSDFVVEMVGKEEQRQLQKALGLGQELLDHQTLVNALVQQTNVPATQLQKLLNIQSQQRRLSEPELLSWLGKWQILRRQLDFYVKAQR
ncbi:DUF4350 domain-containing protein [Mastigocladopsis repens]|uniref:DUF4350 domain-containing protein n=1 Tax=Mastigocladopsis repens TaxID=221287 RepID=UPI00030C646B|nr:DUF4350 domain-containing protein [Mastigocladopsis repens]